jgi:hypothetical protein
MIQPLLPLGQVVITASAEATLERRGQLPIVRTMLNRHALGDWVTWMPRISRPTIRRSCPATGG